MFRILNRGQQVGRPCKELVTAENAVQKKFGASMNERGPGRIDIVDDDGNIIRVYYVN